jgi:GntR family transcriptional regulator
VSGREGLGRLRPPRPGRPAYQQIEEQLVDLIRRGELGEGERLPPERELSMTLGVSRMTLRQGLDGLVQRGLLVRAGGRGTYVAEPKVEQDLRGLRTYPDELRGQGVESSTDLLESATGPAPPVAASALGLEEGAATHRILRLRRASGVPLLLETAWLDAGALPALLEQDLTGSLWDVLASLGRRATRAVERLEPVVATAAEAGALEVAEGAPLMRVERTTYDQDDRPLEHAVGFFRGDRTHFVVEVRADADDAQLRTRAPSGS